MTQTAEPSSQKRIELILQQLEQLPTLPTVAVKVLEATGQDAADVRDVVKLISSDPSLTSRILQLCHRADAGVRGEVSSVERAVVLLGFDAIRSAVLAVSVFQTLESVGGKRDGNFVREEFWKHSLAVACCAELLADALNQSANKLIIDPGEAFVCGLLHDIGKVALDATLPKSFDRVVEAADLLRSNIADLERQVIGVDHMVIGKRLAERWQFPAVIRDCVWLHGQLPQSLPTTVKSPKLLNLITLADVLVREQHIGYSGNYVFNIPKQQLSLAVGVTEQHLTRASRDLVERLEERAAALGLGQSDSKELYQQALSRANVELGRLSGQLVAKNRKLNIRSKFFDALSQFQGELRPDAAPQVVLRAIGQTAVTSLDVRCCCVFSLQPGQNFAEAMLFDETGEAFESTLVDCNTPPPQPAGGDGPVLPAGPDLEWLVSAISPRLTGDQRFWISLQADGACIGGIVWGASAAGESQRLSPQIQEITTIANGWALALRTSQIREESRTLSEQLAEANRQLQNAQGEILRSRMLSSVGEMAAGAAHEMNNPLAIISGRSQLLSQQLTDAKLQHSAKLVFEQSHRLSEIITELMAFARPVPPKPIKTDLPDVLERALHEAKQHVDPADRTIELTMSDLPPVMIDVPQVTDAVREVIENALQATDPVKGHVTIHAAYDSFSSRIAVTVADDGCGMDEKTLRQAFDPFFSAKPAGRRRGMGLAKAMRWVESSGGSIRLESRPEQGCRALILLPAAIDKAAEQKQNAAARRAAQ
ncbi:MAG TPA: HDOD domain-containing protein [Tepidisphaeraceae bacterium]|jgi:putative nucleotidyltransferase with HDIG domain|nr:HDOD domain-containing protein [Tepidisphaeraceae bacterium]